MGCMTSNALNLTVILLVMVIHFGNARTNQSHMPGTAYIQQSYWSLPLDPDGERIRQRLKSMTPAVPQVAQPHSKLEWTAPHSNVPNQESDWIEKRLTKTLLKDYDRRARPVVDHLTPLIQITETYSVYQITVEFGLELIQILDLNEMDQVLTTSVRSLYRWKDYNFLWNPEDYDGIRFVTIPSDYIWLPDIALYNYADERLDERRMCDVRIRYDGTVFWSPMAIFKSTCSVEIKYFPFDQQKCSLKFGPWSHDGFHVNISFYANKRNFQMTNYITNPEWVVLRSSADYTEVRYECCPEVYPDISFNVWLMRHSAFYTYILIVPSVLLSSLTSVIFWLPPETPSKIVLAMNVFVAFLLLHLLLEDTTPAAASSFPLLGAYFCFNMGVITVSMFLSCITVNLHFRADHTREIPRWLLLLAKSVGSPLFVNIDCLESSLNSTKRRKTENPTKGRNPDSNAEKLAKKQKAKQTQWSSCNKASSETTAPKQFDSTIQAELANQYQVNDHDSCWCLRVSASQNRFANASTDHALRDQQSPVTLTSHHTQATPKIQLSCETLTQQVPRVPSYSQSIAYTECNREDDCVLCLRAQADQGVSDPNNSMLFPIPIQRMEPIRNPLYTFQQNLDCKPQMTNSFQGIHDFCVNYDPEYQPLSPSQHSAQNRFHVRLLGPNRFTQNSPEQSPRLYRAHSTRESFHTSQTASSQHAKTKAGRNGLWRLERDVYYITSTFRKIELNKREEDRKNRIGEQWRTICLVLDRVFFLIYLVTLFVSMCLFHPTVMSALD